METSPKIRILVADDHPVFLEGLSRLLNEQKDMVVIAKPVDGKEAVKLCAELRPDVAILDVAMPELNGIEAAKQIKSACPNTAILIISAHDSESFMVGALKAGAAGYLLKNVALPNLLSAIRLVHDKEGVFDLQAHPGILHKLATKTGAETASSSTLQARELQILKLAAKGMGNKRIAQELVISERTVQTHLKNAFEKARVASRTEAVIWALKNGLIDLTEL